MNYEQAQHLKPGEFKRFWGVKLETFKQMLEIPQRRLLREVYSGCEANCLLRWCNS